MWGIPEWEPSFVTETEDVLACCREFVSDVVGQKVECSWVARSQHEIQWCSYLPVILRINGVNYEFCWSKESDFAVTRDSIDVSLPLGSNGEMVWEKDSVSQLQAIIELKILALKIQEVEVTIVCHSRGFFNQYWEPNGLNFYFEDSFFSIYNAFDSNGLREQMVTKHSLRILEV